MVAFISMRPVDMTGPELQLGDSADRSMIWVVAVAVVGSPPPKVMTFGVYAGGYRGSSVAVPFPRLPETVADWAQVAGPGSKIQERVSEVPPCPVKNTVPFGSR